MLTLADKTREPVKMFLHAASFDTSLEILEKINKIIDEHEEEMNRG
jgi:hypothetical protein